ncbi:universal stress protein [Haloarchaeobius litoreus]|uniref:Universal stress protein n=1 Tax=Haloarchaeobius litoreus TaxID=755306 RepID=A0ABD6DS30_9EURY|nr:universal stress protein [Haloarchaeobius litoreus]
MSSVDEVLVAFDGNPLSEKALAHALYVYTDASITVLHVIDYIEERYSAKALVGDERSGNGPEIGRPNCSPRPMRRQPSPTGRLRQQARLARPPTR